MADRRIEARLMCADLVEVAWVDQRGNERTAVANLEDISGAGACLQIDRELPLRTRVIVTSGKEKFPGEVRYCVYREFGYFVGIEFDPGVRWNARSFRPLHLFDPRTLMDIRPLKKSPDSNGAA
jgi:hypothetical protein